MNVFYFHQIGKKLQREMRTKHPKITDTSILLIPAYSSDYDGQVFEVPQPLYQENKDLIHSDADTFITNNHDELTYIMDLWALK